MPGDKEAPVDAIIIVDEVLDTAEIESVESFMLLARTGDDLLALTFSSETARKAAALLQRAADAIERK